MAAGANDGRSLKALQMVLGSSPYNLWVKTAEQAFDAYLLGSEDVVRHTGYRRKVYAEYSGVKYFRPDGWWQFQVAPWYIGQGWPGVTLDKILSTWPVAYHGTSCDNLSSILNAGLRKPGEVPWVCVQHGNAGAGEAGAVYVSPSLWCSSHPVYSPLKRVGTERWVQAVLKVRVRPKSYKVQANTLGRSHWDPAVRMDPNFSSNSSLEWLIERGSFQRCDLVIVGLMVREVGLRAAKQVFGNCPKLGGFKMGPEYRWTSYLQSRLRKGGFLIHGSTRKADAKRKPKKIGRVKRAKGKFAKRAIKAMKMFR